MTFYLENEKDVDPLVEGGVWRWGLAGGAESVDMRRSSPRQVTEGRDNLVLLPILTD